MIEELIKGNRSYRRFDESFEVPIDTITWLINLGRMSASAANLQPLKFIISNTPWANEKIFNCLGWAGYLPEWPGPVAGERPSAYIVILGDTRITSNYWCDHGIATQSILLGAREKGLGGCIFGAINKDNLRDELNIEPHFDILLVIALGKPVEKVVLETVGEDGDIKYWRDPEQVHHVPKRKLEDIIIKSFQS